MRDTSLLLCAVLVSSQVYASDEQDRFEDQMVIRLAQQKAERSTRANRGERGSTVRDLESAFPGKLTKTEPGKNEKEAEEWFKLVAGSASDWRKTDAVAAGLGPMYERWRQRLELGPVPSIKRDEFLKFAKTIISHAAPQQGEKGEVKTDGEADKVFRVLDLNADGELTGSELSAGLKAEIATGRVSKEQYREYFRHRVEKKTEAMSAALKSNDELMRKFNPNGVDKGSRLPDWFTKFDIDKDKQISLYEWRKAGKDIKEFMEMDLDGDFLLTADEYLRWAKQKRDKEPQREDDR